MTLEELIQQRGVNRPTYHGQGLGQESDWAKGYWSGWEAAYNDLKEILIQNNFNLSITVVDGHPLSNAHNDNERCYACLLSTDCERAKHAENYRFSGCYSFIPDGKVVK